MANFQMPQDVMNVLLEGVMPLETRLLLAALIKDGYITLEFLNQRVSNFSYGRTEARTKVPKLFEKAHFETRLHLSG